jgi:hypothetical protein
MIGVLLAKHHPLSQCSQLFLAFPLWPVAMIWA